MVRICSSCRSAEVRVSREVLKLIAQLSIALEVDGHRSDLVCARAAQAKAAYDGAAEVELPHITGVAEMVYAHRVRTVPFGKAGPNFQDVLGRVIGAA